MSEKLGEYLMLKRFWTNLGMNQEDIRALPHYEFEVLNEIMLLEDKQHHKDQKTAGQKMQSKIPKR